MFRVYPFVGPKYIDLLIPTDLEENPIASWMIIKSLVNDITDRQLWP